MSKHQQGPYDSGIIELSLNPGIAYGFNSPEVQMEHPMLQQPQEPGEPHQASNKWKIKIFTENILSVLNPWWNTILVLSCVIAVSFDPLFFYIPYIKEDQKCMAIDKQVMAAALVLRSVTDITFLVHIIYQVREASKVPRDTNSNWKSKSVSSRDQMIPFAKAFSRKLSWRSFLTDICAIFPMPQLLIVGLYFNIGVNNYLLKRKIACGFLLLQYVPRIYRIYLSSTAITHSVLWVKCAFNLFLYILASHVLGAFWYFFSIQRETSCWYQTCIRIHTGTSESKCSFYCHHITSPISAEFNNTLNDNCILKVPYYIKDPPFDFGIFFDALKNDIQGPIKFSEKIVYCFWWGLRNLSNFGTSLETSTNLWENSFAILTSIIGLLLFIYLIGNVQIYMAKATTRVEEIRERIQTKKNDIEKWMEKQGLPDDMKKQIMKNIKRKLEEDICADLEDIYSLLPWGTKKSLKRFLCMSTLRKVPMLSKMDGRVLKLMCDYLQPVKYQENTVVFHMGEPLDRMVLIAEGFMLTYTTATENTHFGKPVDANSLKKGDSYGHVLLQYASARTFTRLPTSTKNLKCHTKVEAFVLMAKDLRHIVTKCEDLWSVDRNAVKDEAMDRVVAPQWQF